ncbi:unnamed protein product [Phytophthora lilii]|uniref:Unnamed protein product n=1 Tax=Phytophthora lilii TaxID=2077276 RepID=A0A9W6TRP4_9STRA|nr:unnamed protein product [Phytophthora lilii]
MESDLAAIKPDLAAMKPKTLTEFTPLSVHEDEFRLDSLSMTRQSDDPIVMTPTLHEFWKGFGEFPPYYFVRMEEVVFWKVIKTLLFGEDRVVIVGSPGVGKSCFLMLIAFYLACIKMEKVLVIRRLKRRKRMNAVVFSDGRGSLEVDYRDSRKWFLSVDSGYVLSQLGRKIDMDKQLKVYTHAKSVGAGFHGVAYELLLHNADREAFLKHKPVVLKMREGSKYEKIEILAPNAVCSGRDEASCYPCLSTLRKAPTGIPTTPSSLSLTQ